MLTLYKITIHILLGFSDHSTERWNPPYRYQNILSPDADGLCLLTRDTSKLPNIVESFAVGSVGKPPHRTDLGTHGLHDLDHSNLHLYTENLSFESYNNGGIGIEEIGGRMLEEDDQRLEARSWGRRRRLRWWRVEAKFPPLLLWLVGQNGWWSRFIHVLWEDCRIVLTKIRIEWSEVLRTSHHEERWSGRQMK
ncbi:uncharacterized protein [Elaeis guineensis]|uniref:Uncharacterized protein LOC114913499 n=1 Tax=Elaeis guineensis var. tenera TaxID=51953 RepID=A0A8N4ES83_ELAGV|nr:uncharacterized protein LOC114913499 [Elaeis guineensis]